MIYPTRMTTLHGIFFMFPFCNHHFILEIAGGRSLPTYIGSTNEKTQVSQTTKY